MKLQTVKPSVFPNRSTYRSASGRQCRLAIFDPQSGLCANHHADQKQNERADVADILFRDAQEPPNCSGHQLFIAQPLLARRQEPRLFSSRQGPRLNLRFASAHTARHCRREARWNHLRP